MKEYLTSLEECLAFSKIWAGRLYGTNTGNVSVKLSGPDESLVGTLRFADTEHGVVVYEISATFDGSTLRAAGKPTLVPEGVQAAALSAAGKLKDTGRLDGEWDTTAGTGGNFVLYPHDSEIAAAEGPEADQLHTKRHTFGAIGADPNCGGNAGRVSGPKGRGYAYRRHRTIPVS